MTFILEFTDEALADLNALKNNPSKKRILKDVIKTLRLMETNLRHPSLNTHEFHSFKDPHGEKVFEAYAQQKTPQDLGVSTIKITTESGYIAI
jgi:hypothetical protein